ncbi:unnamed protein product [Cuscuta campestris]|uniref:Uncharacterized protein n=1 Tax=Cuscuta campestris TaxID=132261 RepID=A0A484MCA5_9ASTE|nr:unnamed protein product [Cuscuta campestris]
MGSKTALTHQIFIRFQKHSIRISPKGLATVQIAGHDLNSSSTLNFSPLKAKTAAPAREIQTAARSSWADLRSKQQLSKG